ncbi:MAG: efflux RND transporter periplasmic adaptor subunit [Tannerellaceae bacterium]|nr:efflux RND transporter periplasmic adaptor subunit [Tannerellaceae bacterium]
MIVKICSLLASLSLLLACGGKSSSTSAGAAEPPSYPILKVEAGEVTLESVYPVIIKGKEDVEIRPRIDGFIDDIFIDEGSSVKAGQTLFKINSPQAEQSLATAEAAVKVAEAQYNTAMLNLGRMLPLADKGIISNVQFEAYKYANQSALANKMQAEASLKNARAMMEWTNVSSPVNGITGAVAYRRGSLVNSQNVLTTVANTGSVFAHFSLNEKALSAFLNSLEGETERGKIDNCPEIELTLADGSVYTEKGRLETITGTLGQTTGAAGLRVEFANPRGELRSGASGKISIPRVMRDALVIPQKATFAQQDKILVYVSEDGKAVQRIINVIPTPDGKAYVVTAGLLRGEAIVADGIATLRNGQQIKQEE